MKLSEYIAQLQELQNAVGDLNVKTFDGMGHVVDARQPVTDHLRILGKRESAVRCWHRFDEEERKGEKVVRI